MSVDTFTIFCILESNNSYGDILLNLVFYLHEYLRKCFYHHEIPRMMRSFQVLRLKCCDLFSGRWGGIWKAPRDYTFTATNNKQTKVELIKKFDNWKYSNGGIEQRMPWISGARLTTSGHAQHSWWGSITGKHYSYEVTG